jgi:DNA invertase Pin-like site-specific DNA recombinase
MSDKVSASHTARKAIVYVRQSTPCQVLHHREGQALQYGMQQRLIELGWQEIEVIDEDLGKSASGLRPREGFQRMVAEVSLGRVGAVAAHELSRFARNSRDWHQLIEICRVVDTLLIDQESVYHPRAGNDRLLLGLKGSLSEYELDLLRQRATEARWAKARRGELLVQAPTGFVKTNDGRLEKHPDRRVQHGVALVFRKFLELGSARQVLHWLREQSLPLPVGRPTERGWELRWRPPTYHLIVKLLRDPTYAGAYSMPTASL